ncbi:MAG: formate dehydrogenase [Selenomonadaceae bacterium]|nr:formate dehydrogenase [Selenomonadaceae bacterium]
MNLKEAFQAQNIINSLSEHAENYLMQTGNVVTVKEKHLRSKAVEGQADEDIDTTNYEDKKFPAEGVIEFLIKLIDERSKLAHAINEAKLKMDFDLDAAVYTNRKRHILASTLDRLVRLQSSHIVHKNLGRGYVFNKEGNQTEYRYDIERIQTIDFDRNKLRKQIKDVYAKADQVSNEIDAALINTQVNYEFPFDIHGDNDSIIEDYIISL